MDKVYIITHECYESFEILSVNRTLEGALAAYERILEEYPESEYTIEHWDQTTQYFGCSIYSKEVSSVGELFIGDIFGKPYSVDGQYA